MSRTDTIFALSSGQPPSGVAVIRLSGPGVRFALETLIDSVPQPRRVSLVSIHDAGGTVLDRGLAVFFPGPASYTGEDVAELHIHGGRAVIASILAALGDLKGLRPAEAGEFSRRAFVNGKLDLTEVEGLADLIAAETEAQRRQALRQADGGLKRMYEGWRDRIVRARAMIEAELDFPDEEDVPGAVSDRVWPDLIMLAGEIARHLEDGRRGERLRDGAEIVVLGLPNAGKSSLVNALARREVAIVTPEPGTTRDVIEVRLDIEGYPVTLVDTAGLRKAAGVVEAEGVRRAEARGAAADLVLWLSETGEEAQAPGIPTIKVLTKADLIDSDDERSRSPNGFDVAISARTGAGLDDLLERIAVFLKAFFREGESPLITRERYRSGLEECRRCLLEAGAARDQGLELRAETLRRAGDAIGRITGLVGVEDLLDVIFREFCVGK